jgi:hypothetical protein
MGDPMGQDAGLARAGSGDDEKRPLRRPDRVELGLVEAFEEALGGRDCDPSMLAAGRGYQLTVSATCAGSFPSHRIRQVYVPFGSGS